jgi:tetratricopeptide (TPR) repeat protein
MNPIRSKRTITGMGRCVPVYALTLLFLVSAATITRGQTPWSELGKTKPGATTAESKTRGPECLQKAQEELNSEGPEKALDMFRSCARDNANSPEIQHALGVVYLLAKKPKDAADALKQSLKLDPNNAQSRAMLGKIYSFEEDRLDLAEDLLKGVLESHPEMSDARMDLGRVYARKKQLDKALAEFGRVLAGERKFALYHLEAGRLLAAMGLKEEARKQFERSLLLEPEFQPAKEHLKLLEQQGPQGPAGASQPGSTDKK